MAGIGVIYNPRSGRNRNDPDASRRLGDALGDHGLVREAGTVEQLYRVAEDFRTHGIDVLAISGGDGTNGVTITGFLDVYGGAALPQIAFLRGGTMNTTANAVGVRRGSPEWLLGRLARAYANRALTPLQNVERHVLRVSNERQPAHGEGHVSRGERDPEGSSTYASIDAPPLAEKYGFIFGTGVVCGYLSEYYSGGSPNPFVAVKTLVRAVGSAVVGGAMIRRMAAPFRGTVELDGGERWEARDYLTVAAGTIDQMGLRFRPFYRSRERLGQFHILGIYASPMRLVGQLPRIFRAAPMQPGLAFDATSSTATLRSGEGPIRYMLDGDLHACEGPLRVSIGPRVRLVVGT